jgi:hypothetical protein
MWRGSNPGPSLPAPPLNMVDGLLVAARKKERRGPLTTKKRKTGACPKQLPKQQKPCVVGLCSLEVTSVKRKYTTLVVTPFRRAHTARVGPALRVLQLWKTFQKTTPKLTVCSTSYPRPQKKTSWPTATNHREDLPPPHQPLHSSRHTLVHGVNLGVGGSPAERKVGPRHRVPNPRTASDTTQEEEEKKSETKNFN